MPHSIKTPKSILITGASSGIGQALALHYAAPGVFLAMSGRNQDRLDDVATACREKGAEVTTEILCVTDRERMEAWIMRMDDWHPLDLVIANAGISGGTGKSGSSEKPEQVRQIFDINLYGVLNTISPILPRFEERRSGQIALISSLAGFRGMAGAPAYSTSKGAVRFYGEALRGALAESGVKVNVVCPGFVRSAITDQNDFPMPFFMEADKAAAIIAKGLGKNTGRIAFPLPTHLASWFISVLPDAVAQKILQSLPAKG